MSNSTVIGEPRSNVPRLVSLRVSGINDTVNPSASVRATVRLTPFNPTEPWATK